VPHAFSSTLVLAKIGAAHPPPPNADVGEVDDEAATITGETVTSGNT